MLLEALSAFTSAMPQTSVGAAATGIDPNAAALAQMGFRQMLEQFDWIGWTCFLVLVVMSFTSIFYIIWNYYRNIMINARMERVISTFWSTPSTADAIRFMEEQPRSEPFSKIALDAASAAAHHQANEGSRLVEALNRSEFIDRALRQAVIRESSRLESGLTLLATTGSSAPFIGLLGTVWAMYQALINIGASGQASLDAVAGPIGKALIMTAIGLGVAIPALLGYNFLTRSNKKINARFDEFAHDLHDFFATGSRVDGVAPKAAAGKK
jgi:biopolymer transport protein ExbB